MDIERLKELRNELYGFVQMGGRGSGKTKMVKTLYDTQTLIDEAIARQSVTSEEVAEAIEWMREELVYAVYDQHDHKAFCIDLAITALQAYDPEPQKGE